MDSGDRDSGPQQRKKLFSGRPSTYVKGEAGKKDTYSGPAKLQVAALSGHTTTISGGFPLFLLLHPLPTFNLQPSLPIAIRPHLPPSSSPSSVTGSSARRLWVSDVSSRSSVAPFLMLFVAVPIAVIV